MKRQTFVGDAAASMLSAPTAWVGTPFNPILFLDTTLHVSEYVNRLLDTIGPATFIADEADIQFSVEPGRRDQASEVLRLLTYITKESNKVTSDAYYST